MNARFYKSAVLVLAMVLVLRSIPSDQPLKLSRSLGLWPGSINRLKCAELKLLPGLTRREAEQILGHRPVWRLGSPMGAEGMCYTDGVSSIIVTYSWEDDLERWDGRVLDVLFVPYVCLPTGEQQL